MRWNDSIDATTLSWVSITPLGVPVVPLVKTSSKTSSADGSLPGRLARFPVRREGGVVRGGLGGQPVHGGRRELGEAGLARVGRITAGAQDEVTGTGGADDGVDRIGRHPQVERHEDEAGVHRPEVGGR